MKWLVTLLAACLVSPAFTAEPATKPNTVDPEAYRAAMERLRAKSATQPSEPERLYKQNRELASEIESLHATIAELRKQIETLRSQVPSVTGDKRDRERIASAIASRTPVWGMTIAQVKSFAQLDERAERFGPGVYQATSLQNGVTEYYNLSINAKGIVTDVVPLGHGYGKTWRP